MRDFSGQRLVIRSDDPLPGRHAVALFGIGSVANSASP
jgi:hypothetical protein